MLGYSMEACYRTQRPSCRQPRNRHDPDIISAGQFPQRRALGTALAGLGLLLRRKGPEAAHVLAAPFRPAPPLGRAGADEVALHIGQTTQHGEHQPASAGAGIPWHAAGQGNRNMPDKLNIGKITEFLCKTDL